MFFVVDTITSHVMNVCMWAAEVGLVFVVDIITSHAMNVYMCAAEVGHVLLLIT